MTDSIHDELRHPAHRVDAEDLAELRRIVRDLSTVLSSVVHIMERDARDAGAPEPRQELLGELLDLANNVGERLDPERAGRR
ncbi:MAG: hypothetical protein K0Q71_5156 [Thermomicrobiales bacterium]|nr:hypothetical protein [Thermomicrobiales bacterium]